MKNQWIRFILLLSTVYCTPVLSAQTQSITSEQASTSNCQFHATKFISQGIQLDPPSDTAQYLTQMEQARDLELKLDELQTSSSLWSKEQTKTFIELAQVKYAIGDIAEARQLYENALGNMRITDGISNPDQLPIIMDLMLWYISEDEKFTDELGDKAAFIVEKTFQNNKEVSQFQQGFQEIIKLRVIAHASQNKPQSSYSLHVALHDDAGIRGTSCRQKHLPGFERHVL